MGLLYVAGVPFHDEDQELIELSRERRSNRIEANEDAVGNGFTQREVLRSLSEEVRQAARARASISVQ